MDYFQTAVYDYLQERGMFIKAECLIQLDLGNVLPKGTSWYCDAVAISFKKNRVYLCEVSYSETLYTLGKRLREWSREWPKVCKAIARDYGVPDSLVVQPWVFVPERLRETLDGRLSELAKVSSDAGTLPMPTPKVKYLELVLPWEQKKRMPRVCATESQA